MRVANWCWCDPHSGEHEKRSIERGILDSFVSEIMKHLRLFSCGSLLLLSPSLRSESKTSTIVSRDCAVLSQCRVETLSVQKIGLCIVLFSFELPGKRSCISGSLRLLRQACDRNVFSSQPTVRDVICSSRGLALSIILVTIINQSNRNNSA